MIITRTPYRISLFGGGTDHPEWYRKNNGAVVSFTIDKYCYINLRELPPFFEHSYRISYSKVETQKDLNEIEHPAVREAFRKFAPNLSLELNHLGDLPARSGVGSSSAFAVGIVNALLALNKKSATPSQLANLSIDLEQNILKENVGSQDQIACAFGGINYIKFGPGNSWTLEKINLSPKYIKEIENRIVLIYSGIGRLSSDINASLLENLNLKFEIMNRTRKLAEECKAIFDREGDLNLIGPMLTEGWQLKKMSNPLSVTEKLEKIFLEAAKAGAEGGKILGAGGGGFFLFWVNPKFRDSFIQKMGDFITVAVRIVNQGSKRIQ
jgi:D-glycero-alpha-D-manno-heptose-7-phosphate kinase